VSITATEASIQNTLKEALEACGYIVGEVAKTRSRRAAGAWTGTTPGLPDLFVTHPDWHDAMWVGIELKTETGKLRPEQEKLHGLGRTVVARSVYEGISAVLDVDSIEGRSEWASPSRLRRIAKDFKDAKPTRGRTEL
jgi:hypothetical protein